MKNTRKRLVNDMFKYNEDINRQVMTTYRACKVRIYPSDSQEKQFIEHSNACRYVYNWGLSMKSEAYKTDGTNLSTYDLDKMLTIEKKKPEMGWLNEVSDKSLRITLNGDLKIAYSIFYSGGGFPKFRSKKKCKMSFPLEGGKCYLYFKSDKTVKVPKCGTVRVGKLPKWLKVSSDTKLIRPRITQKSKGKWILSFKVEYESQAFKLSEDSMGIDLGLKELATVTVGDMCYVYKNINKTSYMKRLERRVKHYQRHLSRIYTVNHSYEETRRVRQLKDKIKRLYEHIANIRHDYRHKVTTELVRMLPKRIVVEDLDVSSMMKNRHLSKAISSVGFYEFKQMIGYKCGYHGIEFIKADRYYKSSRICSSCGNVKKHLELSDRIYKCSVCGLKIDRDVNASINLSRYVDVSC